MNKIKLISILLLLCLTLWFCQKKIFGHIEVKGRVLHFFTKQPLSVPAVLSGEDATAYKGTDERIVLCSGHSNSDGTFILKSKPSKRDNYWLYLDNLPWSGQVSKVYPIENKTDDLGDILFGSQTFYCRIKVVGSTNSNINFSRKYNLQGDLFIFDPGTVYEFLYSITYSYNDYETNNHNFLIDYFTTDISTGVKTFSNMNLPIHNTDTLNTTISF